MQMKKKYPLSLTKQIIIDIPFDEIENGKVYAYDELIIKYINGEDEYILFKDFVVTGFNLIESLFQKALANSLKIDHSKFPKGIGYEWVVISHAIAEEEIELEDITSPYRLWTTPSYLARSTWIYNDGEKSYIEISPEYRWDYNDPEEGECFESFDSFVERYDCLENIEIDKEILEEILNEIEEVAKKIYY
ncbi:hypothetical protein A5821_000101 [Enterococcus sp. 7F3_DIV0205]|uniref:Uncharacterized protein n=1 Tax=Candidatus Enterococcus palustris TaxID=1834189 RepID=A0AAQ3W7S0_9ENTE|nr:hypothetical protein [Enterococcus sp. 7F3_DIV0205]OTN84507.1 hypothetical protein A5821_000435 [Enterococcus sp. 7F3_DIV0205]